MNQWPLILAIILMLSGLLGTFVPLLPGTPIIFLAIIGYGWFEGFQQISIGFIGIMLVLTIFSLSIDYLAGAIGAKRYGASKFGQWGAVIGGLAGLVTLGPLGIIVGPLIGAVIGEMLNNRSFLQSFSIGLGTLIGLAGGFVIRLIIAITMIAAFVIQVW